MTEISDAAARELIETATNDTLFVEAGAGTGKTTALVSRVLALVREGVPISAVAAITFTEKAASELSERVRKRVEQEAEKATGGAKPRFEQAIRDLDQAAIQTLHSFAMRILSLYPLEAGLPPRLSLRDDVAAKMAFQERWQRFQDSLLGDPALERHLLRGLTAGLRLRDLREVAENFNENWERLQSVELPACAQPELEPWRIYEAVDAVSAQRRPGADDSLSRKLDGLVGYVGFLRGLGGQLQAASDPDARASLEVDLLRLLTKMPSITTSSSGGPNRLGQARQWPDIGEARALMDEAEAARREMLDGTRSAVICALLPRIRDFVLEGAAERRRLGELEFHDLLVLARDLLRNNTDVRRALHVRFQRILIDEFQDTDPIQVELAALLASREGDAPSHWDAAATEPGRLFFVGDPKQSIYRFRRADIELFKRASVAFHSRHLPLTLNFRCRPGIIDWVNTVAGEMFGGFGAGVDPRQADWIPLEAAKSAGKGPAVHLIGGGRDGNIPGIRREEADAIVATVLEARRENWLHRDDPKVKQTRFADIAILLPTRTNSPAIERALGDAGIPARVESRSLLFAAQEIRDLTNILAAIDDPTDDISVVAALRSPAFAVPDTDLLGHVNAGGRWDYTTDQPDGSPATVRDGMESLRGFHAARWHASIGALVERVIADRKMLELAVAGPRPRESWRRLRFVSEQARALGDAGTVASLRQFVQWLRTQAAENARIAEAVANEPDDDAVRLLTVHASKGLEFPIVILAGLGTPPRFGAPRVAWGRAADGRESVEVRTGRQDSYFATPGYAALSLNEREHSFLERDRLFYVAATRAKERLVVSAFHKAVKDPHRPRHADRKCCVAECIEDVHLSHPEWDVLQRGMALGPGVQATLGREDTPEARAAWVSRRAATIARLGEAPVLAATTIAHDADAPAEDEKPEQAAEGQPWRKGRAATSVGRAVHAVLQTVDLATGAGLADTARSQAVAEGIADEESRIARLAENARTSAAVREAVASGRYWREVYVGAEVEGVLIEGFIDLLYETPDGLVIVDYKTDSARDNEAIDRAMERYRLQGASYAMVLERALGRPVARVVFVFTEPRQERRVDDLEGAKAAVREAVRVRLTPAGG